MSVAPGPFLTIRARSQPNGISSEHVTPSRQLQSGLDTPIRRASAARFAAGSTNRRDDTGGRGEILRSAFGIPLTANHTEARSERVDRSVVPTRCKRARYRPASLGDIRPLAQKADNRAASDARAIRSQSARERRPEFPPIREGRC